MKRKNGFIQLEQTGYWHRSTGFGSGYMLLVIRKTVHTVVKKISSFRNKKIYSKAEKKMHFIFEKTSCLRHFYW